MPVTAEEADVVVIGSGASGGMAAWNLTRQGAKVLLLDAGARFDRSTFWTHVKPWEARQRQMAGGKPPQFFVDNDEQPYVTNARRPFEWLRVWGVGGKTNVWGRVSLRYAERNLREPEVDGWEIPWPLGYGDLAPYYDNVERLIGVCGGTDDDPWLPGSNNYMPPPGPRCGEVLMRHAAESVGKRVVPCRVAVRTRDHRGAPACHYCGSCGKGCDTASFFNAADHILPEAEASGNLSIVENAVVARIHVDAEGLAESVEYHDRLSGKQHFVPARRVVVGASCVDTTRILLNSTSAAFPTGIGNSSDVIGRYLCEQVRVNARAFAPQLFGRPSSNDDGLSGGHVYMPRDAKTSSNDYLRGFGIELWGAGCQPKVPYGKELPGFGSDLKHAIRQRYPAVVELHPFGETLPRPENRITTAGSPLDRYGVPQAKIEYEIGDNELKMIDRMHEVVDEIFHAMKAEVLPRERHGPFGSAIHEHGTCRMGADPKRSALTPFNQMYDVRNVFVVDGSAFPSATEKNPTLTILALSWRATDWLVEQMRRGEL